MKKLTECSKELQKLLLSTNLNVDLNNYFILEQKEVNKLTRKEFDYYLNCLDLLNYKVDYSFKYKESYYTITRK